MSTSANNHFDTIEKLIFDEGWSIETLDFHPELDVMIIVLNTKAILKFALSSFKNLKGAAKEALYDYEIIGNGFGVHWNALDEDLSLKGFLQQELINNLGKKIEKAA